MAKYKKVRKLTPEEAAYIAGLVDGEGTIALTRKYRGEHRQLMVSISSTEPPLLSYVKKTIGAGRITHKRTYQANHTPGITYAISNRQALSVLEQVSPYLRTYKSQTGKIDLGKLYPPYSPEREVHSGSIERTRVFYREIPAPESTTTGISPLNPQIASRIGCKAAL